MDIKRKLELLDEWENRHPEMGVIMIKCTATGDEFMGISKDTRADFNSNRFKLQTDNHPNKNLQQLWEQYGNSDFEFSTIKILEYKDLEDDHTSKLEAMLVECLKKIQGARRIWR